MSPRYYHSATYCRQLHSVIVFGGYDGKARLNDVHILDLVKLEWRQLAVKGDSPSPRCWHAAAWTSIPAFATVDAQLSTSPCCCQRVLSSWFVCGHRVCRFPPPPTPPHSPSGQQCVIIVHS